MDIALKPYIAALSLITPLGCAVSAQPSEAVTYAHSMTESYSQKTLLKNWAFSVCLAMVAKDKNTQEDANATASAYLEFGRRPIEEYDALKTLAEQYANRKYGADQSNPNSTP